ncbi:helix-turn-helix domain-containing protein [Naasia aerilata]|nr:XRE family transcriptional regulator [Naasia aerilata]
MQESAVELAAAIGGRVRQERQARAWTLDQLAEVAGVSRRMIVSIEQGATNPSVGTLLRISDALGVGLPSLVAPAEMKPVRVIRSGEGATLWSSTGGGRGVLLAGTESPDVLELWEWTLAPGDEKPSDAHSPRTKEILHVHEGSLAVQVGGQAYLLGAGDALSFSGDVPHAYANPGNSAVRFTMAILEPGVGSAAGLP